MYLQNSLRKKSGRRYLSIVHGYRDDMGITRTKTIKSLGYLDELEKEYDDPITHFKELAALMDAQRKEANKKIALEFSPLEKVDMRKTDNRINLGYSVLSHYYHALQIDSFWDNRRMRAEFEYNPNAIFKLLVYGRILYPSSKLATFENKGRFLDRMDFSRDDMYRSLGFFDSYKADLLVWLNEHIDKMRKGRKIDSVYYDVTNYYFEVDKPDELKRRGVSKEHRPNPIVQMGLLLDEEGIPVTYRLYSGNTNDCLTLMPILKELRKKYGLRRIITVADKGCNTSDNIAASILDGNGYIFSQSVRKADKELKGWVLKEDGYKAIGGDFKIKSREGTKTVFIENSDGKKEKVPVPVRQVAFWSRDYDVRSKELRREAVQKARELISRPSSYDAATSYGATKYIKNFALDKKTGEILGKTLVFDETKLAEEEALDGYYCIITSEIDKTDTEILDIYRGLWRIEETFKVTKSDLSARPVYVSRHEHIEAHFLTCYVALVLLRLIQVDTDFEYSAARIAETLKEISGTYMKENYYLFGYRSELSGKLAALADVDLTRKVYSLGDMRKILAKTKRK